MNVSVFSIKDWADTVKEAYLVNGMPPTDTVEELAIANDLNSNQVQRLCQASNLAIKIASRSSRIDDVMFPLASAAEVQSRMQPNTEWSSHVDEVKTASLAPVSRVQEYSRHYILENNRPSMVKTASADISSRAHSSMLKQISTRCSSSSRQLTMIKKAASNGFDAIITYLSDEAKIARNINGSYTAAMSLTDDKELVDDIYKTAHRFLSDKYPYPIPSIIKTAKMVPNPSSEIVQSIIKYASLLSKIEEEERALSVLEGQRKIAHRRFREALKKEM